MEKKAGARKRILKFLPKAASAVNFHSLPFSPGREKRFENTFKHKAIVGRGFSGPITSIIPVEARSRQSKNESFETQEEPTSPKVSCIGQIKHKKKMNKATYKRVLLPPQETPKPVQSQPRQVKKHASKIKRLFTFAGKAGRRRSGAGSDGEKPTIPDRAPSLSQMKRFASGRDHSLANFDWTAHQIALVESDNRDYYSDEERRDGFEEEEEEEEVIIPFSAPITVGGGAYLQPRKEINLWKRRTMNPPMPLHLNSY